VLRGDQCFLVLAKGCLFVCCWLERCANSDFGETSDDVFERLGAVEDGERFVRAVVCSLCNA
jgi:hypothetical protein